ncbi:MAG: V-type ATPase 116kDa subunit family protein [bacterium]
MFIKEYFNSFLNIFKKYGFTQVTLPIQKNTVFQNLEEIKNNFIEIKLEKEKVIKETQSLGFDKIKLMIKSDYISKIIKQKEIKYHFSNTKQSILISGWIKKNNTDTIIKKLSQFKETEILFLAPSPEENPPVDLNNKNLFKPFEIITELYGIPHYKEVDPTPFLAPFFALFFALCMTDAGYGLMILLASFFLLKKFSDKGAKKFLHLFIILSSSTVIVGILTGGFFGIDFKGLPSQLSFLQNIRKSIMLFDPIENAMTFFIIAIGLGIIHILLGFFIKMIWKIKNGFILDTLLDEMPWIVIIISCIFLCLISIFSPHLILAKNICFICFVMSCLTIVVFGGRPRKGFKRILVGIYKLYGIMGIVGDILSYTRLLALGLVSCVLASVINIVGGVFWSYGISFFEKGGIGFILFLFCAIMSLLVIVGGHLFIILISILGSFIHTMRLQFVEFFTKFYEGGGDFFSPFKKEEKYIRFKN